VAPAVRGLLVEFVGMPGVGKSELSHRVAARLAAAGERVREPSQLAQHPLASLRALAAIGRTRQRGFGTRVRLAVNALLVASLAAQARRRPGIHLLDQSLLQAAWSVALDDRPGSPLPLLDTGGLRGAIADLVVIVDADLDTVQRRLSERPGHDSRLEQEGAGPAALQRGALLVGEVRAAVQRGRLARVIEAVNDTQGLDRLTAEVAAQIADFARAAPPAANGVRNGLDPSPTKPPS
jgi:thymidylate kinase